MPNKDENHHDMPERRYGTVATRDIENFQGYRTKPCPSLMPTGDINISNRKLLDTEKAFDDFCRRIREEHDSKYRVKKALLGMLGIGCGR